MPDVPENEKEELLKNMSVLKTFC